MNHDHRQHARHRLDERIAALRPTDRFAAPPRGWLRAIRDAIGMTGPQLARRLGITAQSVTDFERSETTGTIQLKTLRRAAEAMGCTLVYAIVPNTSLEDLVDARARQVAVASLQRVAHSMALEDQAVTMERAEEQLRKAAESAARRRDLWDD